MIYFECYELYKVEKDQDILIDSYCIYNKYQ